jgi:hypothetical protein
MFTEKEIKSLASYIADYLAEENVAEIDSFLVMNAIDAYMGGASETKESVDLRISVR